MIITLKEKKPKIGKDVYIAESAQVIGKVSVGEHSSIWPHAVLRADIEPIKIGKCSSIQDGVLIHVNWGLPAVVGNYVTVGHGAIIHGCKIANNCLIGMGAIILDGAEIKKNCLIGAGSLVPEGRKIPEGSLVLGVPGRVVRKLNSKEIKKLRESALEYFEFAKRFKEK
ncbi:gamma carbonic anhydrase family protein [bacterium]|nr:gamma carbonic anhydrase family protein [bacterium]